MKTSSLEEFGEICGYDVKHVSNAACFSIVAYCKGLKVGEVWQLSVIPRFQK